MPQAVAGPGPHQPRASFPTVPHPSHLAAPATPTAPSPPRRRITGIDVARAVAILGMLVAHLGTGHHVAGGGWGEQWMWIFDGRSSALFATLAGVSLALMTRRLDPGTRAGWGAARVKIAVRAVVLLPIGIALQMLGTPIAIILPTYAVLFLMAIPVLRLPTRWLLAISAVAVTLGPILVLGLRWATTDTTGPTTLGFGFGVGELVWGYYPALVWIGYLLVGYVVGRGALASTRYAAALVVLGSATAMLGYGSGALATHLARESGVFASGDSWTLALLDLEPHATSPFEVVGNIGVALVVIGACLLLTTPRPLARLLSPLAALGAMSLTVYTAQIVVIVWLGEEAVYFPASNLPLVVLALASIAFAWVWQATLGRGPLERLLTVASDAAASRLVGAPR